MRLPSSAFLGRLLVAFAVSLPLVATPQATFIGPIPYLSCADSPFYADITNGLVFLETFESGALSVPGVMAPFSRVIPSEKYDSDSVDADDGQIDGSGSKGHSLYSSGLPLARCILYF